jgi:hypothetical protein
MPPGSIWWHPLLLDSCLNAQFLFSLCNQHEIYVLCYNWTLKFRAYMLPLRSSSSCSSR